MYLPLFQLFGMFSTHAFHRVKRFYSDLSYHNHATKRKYNAMKKIRHADNLLQNQPKDG